MTGNFPDAAPLTKSTGFDPRRTLTLRDVSEASGVSEMTVSRVLRNRGDVSDATRERVLELAKDWGSETVDLGAVGHLNPASGYGEWPMAQALIERVSAMPLQASTRH